MRNMFYGHCFVDLNEITLQTETWTLYCMENPCRYSEEDVSVDCVQDLEI